MSKIGRGLCVGGVFDDEGGRGSGYFAKFAPVFSAACGASDDGIKVVNGGSFADLEGLMDGVGGFDAVLWAADVPNDKPKLVRAVKERNPKAMLVITKSNVSGKYDRMLLTARALQSKANLLVEFVRDGNGRVAGSLWDPLGNLFVERESDVGALAKAAGSRLAYLASVTRVGSVSVGPASVSPAGAEVFFALARGYADRFHELIHGTGENGRMMGNLSFRCENGFPSAKDGLSVWVSRRNVDKRALGPSGMVEVALGEGGATPVEYLGDDKPSVDTPIQRELYLAWPKARFMLHAHVFVKGAPFTKNVVPCGALEEAFEIMEALGPEYDGSRMAFVNLRGHGSLAVGPEASGFEGIGYVATEEEALV